MSSSSLGVVVVQPADDRILVRGRPHPPGGRAHLRRTAKSRPRRSPNAPVADAHGALLEHCVREAWLTAHPPPRRRESPPSYTLGPGEPPLPAIVPPPAAPLPELSEPPDPE